jgi:hypothetical protein
MEIQKVTIKKGFYDSVEDVEIYIPSTAVWINEQSTEGRRHSGNFHYLGIVPYKDYLEYDKFMQKNIEDETSDSDFETYLDYFVKFFIGKEYVLFGLSDANDMGQFNMVSVDTFNSICDFSKYTVIRLKRFEIEYIGKIKRINGLYSAEVVTVNKETIDTGVWKLESLLHKQNYDDDYITIIKKNNVVTKYYRQAIYNILSTSGIPVKKSWNYNINLNAIKEQQEYMSKTYDVFNLTDEQTAEFTEDMKFLHKLMHFNKYMTL